MKVAALDLGSNTFLCLIAEVENGRVTEIYQDVAKVVRLGQGVQQTKKFHVDALKRAKECLQEFSKIIQQHRPQKILAMATSAARDVENSEELFKLAQSFSIPLEIIPGEKEAAITYSGATAGFGLDNKNRIVIDVGGGSTEFILGNNSEVVFAKSLDIGCVRLTERFFSKSPPKESEVKSLSLYIEQQLQDLKNKIDLKNIHEVIAVAGTPTALAAAELGGFVPDKVEGYTLTVEGLSRWCSKLSSLSAPEISEKYGVEKGRADVLLAGVLILQFSLKALAQEQLTVSTKGVRFGVAIEVVRRNNA